MLIFGRRSRISLLDALVVVVVVVVVSMAAEEETEVGARARARGCREGRRGVRMLKVLLRGVSIIE